MVLVMTQVSAAPPLPFSTWRDSLHRKIPGALVEVGLRSKFLRVPGREDLVDLDQVQPPPKVTAS